MEAQIAQFANRGMNQDISVSKATNEFAFKNYNIRITAVNNNTLLSVTNEKLPRNINVSLDIPATYNRINVSFQNHYETTSSGSATLLTKLVVNAEHTLDCQVQLELTVITKTFDENNNLVDTEKKLIHTLSEGTKDLEYVFEKHYNTLSDAKISSHGATIYSYYTQYENKPSYEYISTATAIPGEYLGHAILNDYLVLFTKGDSDCISVLEYNEEANTFVGKVKYSGNLNFSLEYPIETLAYYESDEIQKVYWVDGLNQTRVINIVADNIVERLDTQFDCNPTVNSFPNVTITKEHHGIGVFPSGVIQYFISYYNKFGAETGIVWSSDIQEISHYDIAASPEDTVVCDFKITIRNIDATYDYIRVYSLIRTSLNGEVICSIVDDVAINNSTSITIVDTNTNVEPIDSTTLLFLGGDNFIASTLTQKDNVLFLGNLKINNLIVPDEIKDLFITANESPFVEFITEKLTIDEYNSSTRRIFKSRELYRIGIQFQDGTTRWTTPIWIGDIECPISIKTYTEDGVQYIEIPKLLFNKPVDFYNITSKYYVNYRLLMVEPTTSNRKILAQGFLSPTVFSVKNRITKNGAYSIGSWISRPIGGNASFEHLSSLGNEVIEDKEGNKTFGNLDTCEIQNTLKETPIIQSSSNTYILDFHINYHGIFVAQIWNVGDKGDLDITAVEPELINSFVIGTGTQFGAIGYDDPYIYNQIVAFYNENLPGISLNGLSEDIWLDYVHSVMTDLTHRDYELIEGTEWSSGGFWKYNGITKLKNNEGNGYHIKAYTYVSSELAVKTLIKNKNGYYVDSSLVTFHTPDIDNIESIVETDGLQVDIVGIIPITSSYTDITLETSTASIKSNGGLIKSYWDNSINKSFTNHYVYQDYGWNTDGSLNKGYTYNYYVYLWNKSGSIIGQTSESHYYDINNPNEKKYFTDTHAKLEHKIIATKRTSDYTTFLNNDIIDTYNITPMLFDSSEQSLKTIKDLGENNYYQGNVDTIVKTIDDYKVFWNDVFGKNADGHTKQNQSDPVSIKFKKTKHIAFNLKKGDDLYILPSLDNMYKWDLNNLYEDTASDALIPWLDGYYYQNSLEGNLNEKNPYLYLAEIVRVSDENLYGDTTEENLKKHTWIPISYATGVGKTIRETWGDTYYQRWDCLNTYPYTEEDQNSVVDIVSFMVESHNNLNGRYDINKNTLNILNARPTNFNVYNDVYTQTDNYFSYNILDEKYNAEQYWNQVAFSLQKSPTSNIDTWCNISLASSFNLDGSYGKLNKLINVSDAIIAFQDKAISVINFNNRTALSTESGVPIEIANSGKVDGYTTITQNNGCTNKWSICKASSGVYFADDLNKTFMRFNKEGINNISSNGMSMWFKDNLSNSERVFYDAITNDIYVTNSTDCVVYNEGLQSFTSFMDYNDIDVLFNLKGHSFILDNLAPKKMFDGNYSHEYYVQYKVNPEPYMDKTFTNIEYIADCIPSGIDIDTVGKTTNLPFNKLEVWNEYQEGSTDLAKRFKYPNFENKFRIWRADIPRDNNSKYKLDRIRNPWIYLKLSSDNNHFNKMVFHNLLVKYFK